MSSPEAAVGEGSGGAIRQTRVAVSRVFESRAPTLVFAVTTLGYLLGYLAAIGHLAPGLGGFEVSIVADPLSALTRPALGPLTFEPVASVALGPVTLLVSLNTLFGALLAGLVGVNLAVSYLAWTQPSACGLGGPAGGLAASIPALLSGTACCGPVVLLAVGIQVSGVVLTTVQYLLPVAILLLLGSLILVARRVNPAAVTT